VRYRVSAAFEQTVSAIYDGDGELVDEPVTFAVSTEPVIVEMSPTQAELLGKVEGWTVKRSR
jgi:hypothetical protein